MKSILQSGNKIHFISLGCARNLVDTEVMLGIVLKAGYEISADEKKADYFVVNTCGFLESARQEALDILSAIFTKKKKNAKVVVAGCMVPKHGPLLKEKFPHIHNMIGPGDVGHILSALTSAADTSISSSARSFLEWGEVPRYVTTPSHYAYLKIAEGCAKRCSFCIIPTIKGQLQSKPQDQVIKEMRALRAKGVHELVLIAQDLGDYGKEWGKRDKEQGRLETLLRTMLAEPGEFWLRLLYLYPDEISDELIDLMEKDSRLLPYLDMPIQHISSSLLKDMKRKTSKEQIISTYEKLRSRIPHIVIRTSLMVGFPGETEENFAELLDFVRSYPLDNVGVFQFSPEKEAPASLLPNQIPQAVKEERYHELMKVQSEMVSSLNKKYIGQTLSTLVEGYHPDSPYLMRGRFYGQCPEIDGQIIINDSYGVEQFGTLYDVEISDVAGYDLIGQVVPSFAQKKESKKKSKLAIVS